MLLAFVGGLVLNLMPCVFPVLSLKALSLDQARPRQSPSPAARGPELRRGRASSRSSALPALLLAFRAAGEQFGWGFQLQSPAVVDGLALLFFVLALNLSGVFEFATLVPSSAAGWTAQQPVR